MTTVIGLVLIVLAGPISLGVVIWCADREIRDWRNPLIACAIGVALLVTGYWLLGWPQ